MRPLTYKRPPVTGTPEVGGITTVEAQKLLRGLGGLSLVGGDVVEVATRPLFGSGQYGSRGCDHDVRNSLPPSWDIKDTGLGRFLCLRRFPS